MTAPLYYFRQGDTAQSRREGVALALRAIMRVKDSEFSFSRSPQTDGHTVYLGNLDAEREDFPLLAIGHGIHELMHVRETDMGEIARCASAFERMLLNVLEDVRIDTLGGREHASYTITREALAMRLEELEHLKASACDPKRTQPPELFGVWLHTLLLSQAGTDWAMRLLPRWQGECERRFPQDFLDSVTLLSREIFSATDTASAAAIARKIVKLCGRAFDQNGSDRTKNASEPPLESQACRQRDSRKIISLRKLTALRDEDMPSDPMALPASAYSEQDGDTGSITDPDGIRVLEWNENAEAFRDGQTLRDATEFTQAFNARLNEFRRIESQFCEALKVHADETGHTPSRFGDGLSDDFIDALASGDDRLFVSTESTERHSGSVMILLDRSGSMGVDTMTSAKLAVAGLASALWQLEDMDVTVAAFPAPKRHHVATVSRRGERFTAFLERFKKVGAFGSTPIVQALDWARAQLEQSSRELRLAIVVTDGVCPIEKTETAQAEFDRAGVELAILCIGVENEGLARNVVNVQDDTRIAPALLHLLKQSRLHRERTALIT